MNRKMTRRAPAPGMVRARTLDHLTFDQQASLGYAPLDTLGNQRGITLAHAYETHDSTPERRRTVDSTGAFLVGELERLDQTLHMPLAAVTWSRDIDLREDVTIADELSSYTLTTFGSQGSLGTGNGIRNGKAWIGKDTNQIGGVGVDTGKIANPLTPWALEIKYTVLELESAAKMGRPIDAQKYEALKLKHQMDIDEQIYVGDSTLAQGGLVNNARVTNVANVANGTGGTPQWTTKTPNEILADVNALIISAWAATGYSVMPNRILVPPNQFGYINATIVSTAGNQSILRFLLDNNIIKNSGAGELVIAPAKWLVGAGAGGTIGTAGTVDRMVAYNKQPRFVRFPMVPMQRTPIQYDAIYHKMSYYCRLGVVEIVYPETVAYRDGI
ncbi:hypothetical protein D3C87_1034720 [compost metagenome]